MNDKHCTFFHFLRLNTYSLAQTVKPVHFYTIIKATYRAFKDNRSIITSKQYFT